MSTVTHEPQLGQPQTSAGAELLQQAQPQMGQMPAQPGMVAQPQMGQMPAQPGMVAQPGMGQMPAQPGMPAQPQMGQMPAQPGMVAQPGMGQMPAQPGMPAQPQMGQMPAQPGMPQMGQMPQQVEQINPAQGQIGNIENIPNPNLTPNMVPQSQQVNEFPTIPDNNPVATLPENTNTGILEQSQMGMPQQGMSAQPQMGMPQQGMGQIGQMQAQPQMGIPQQGMGQMGQMQAQPQMQQINHQGMNQFNQTQYQPQGQPQQQIPGSTAPGFNNGSYLQQQGGMFGPTPTGHPEKQKFQAQFTLVYAKAKTSSKGSMYTSGLIANPTDRNAPAINFMCFSAGATKQIQILDDAQSRPMYTNIEKAGGQPIWVEASWQWNDKNKNQPPAWQLMCDNLIFINDQNFRQTAENWVPPVPPSPMDMLAGGNMQMQQMMGQMPQQGMPGMQAQPQMSQMPQQGMPQYQMPTQPGKGQMPQQGMVGMPGMPGMGQMPQQGMA